MMYLPLSEFILAISYLHVSFPLVHENVLLSISIYQLLLEQDG
jgi:hypothetical protein